MPTFRTAAASLLAITLCAGIADAAAQAPGPGGPGGPESPGFGIGLGVMSARQPYKGTERETRLLPFLQYENQYLKLSPMGIDLKLPSLDLGGRQRLEFALVGRRSLDGAGYEAEDSPYLAGMAERERGYWVGAKLKWRTDYADVSAEWHGDAASKSKGQRFGLNLEKPWRLGPNVMVVPRIGLAWVDDNYVDYYFGVRPGEAAPGRPAYVGSSGVLAGAGVSAMYRFDAHHSMMVDARVLGLARSIKDSPLVDASTENRLFMGYSYRF